MKSLYLAIVLVSLAAWLRYGHGQLTCDKKSSPCTCEGTNFSKIDVEEALKSSINVPIKDSDNPGKYEYLVNFCSGFTCPDDTEDGGGKDAVACQRQIDGQQNVSYKLGDVKQYSWQVFENNTFAILFKDGDPADNDPRLTMLYVFVVGKDDGFQLNNLTFIEERKNQPDDSGDNKAHVYTFYFYITANEEDKGGSSGSVVGIAGIVIILLLLVGFVAYFVIGIIVMITVKKARGVEVIPQYTFWKSLPGLIKDGFLFTISPCRKLARGKSYQSI